jgi:predicted RNase H-like HicB family nuclease
MLTVAARKPKAVYIKNLVSLCDAHRKVASAKGRKRMDRFYPIVVVPLNPEDGGGYVGYAFDLKGCMSHGETPEEAFASTQEAVQEWIEEAKALSREIPAPGSASARAREDRKRLLQTMQSQASAMSAMDKKIRLLWRICGSGRGPFVRFNPAGWILLLRLWACGHLDNALALSK